MNHSSIVGVARKVGRCAAFRLFLSILPIGPTAACQNDDPAAIRFETGEETIWEFGLKIDATGNLQGVTATCPVPVDWPEQSIEIVEEKKSELVSRTNFDDSPQNVRQLVIKINSLAEGQSAAASVVYRVKKKSIIPPKDPELLQFADPLPEKLRHYLQKSPNIETTDKKVKAFADSIPVDKSLSAWRQVESIYDWIRDAIPYEFDPQIRTCMEAIERKKGDCEELSSLFIAVCRVKQIPARAVWIPDHTYPEFYLVNAKGEGQWFPCQLAGSREFGGMTEPRPILQKGDKFRLPGNSQPLRYVQPTLFAKDAKSPPGLSWISREIVPSDNDDEKSK